MAREQITVAAKDIQTLDLVSRQGFWDRVTGVAAGPFLTKIRTTHLGKPSYKTVPSDRTITVSREVQ